MEEKNVFEEDADINDISVQLGDAHEEIKRFKKELNIHKTKLCALKNGADETLLDYVIKLAEVDYDSELVDSELEEIINKALNVIPGLKKKSERSNETAFLNGANPVNHATEGYSENEILAGKIKEAKEKGDLKSIVALKRKSWLRKG